MKFAMFPGQGSQYEGMAKELLNEFPYISTIFEEASDGSGIDLKKLCVSGSKEDLVLTENTQPAILTTSYAIWNILEKEKELKVDIFAGHSLGEYSALVAAKKLKLFDAAKTVRLRGEAMQKAVPKGEGSMAAVIGTKEEDIQSVCERISKEGYYVGIANYNSPAQHVIAGHKSAVDEASQELGKVIPLKVSAPFHTPLMGAAREMMEPVIQSLSLTDNSYKMIPNVNAKITVDYAHTLLCEQIDSPVRWTQTLQTASEMGVTEYIEVGPSKVLCGLVKKTLGRDTVAQATDPIKEYLA